MLSYKEFAKTKLDQRVRLIQVVRFFIATAFLLGALIFQPEDAWNSQVFMLFIYSSLGYFLYGSLLIFLYLFQLVDVSKSYTILQVAFDFLFFSLFIVSTAGINSQFKYLYWLLIFYTGLLFDLEGAVLSAVIAGFLFALLANFHFLLEEFKELYFLRDIVTKESRVRTTFIITNCFGFILFGSLSALIGRVLNRAEYDAYTKLQQVKKLKEKIQKSEKFVAMGQMAARIAHEIRNPLTSISASIEMLKSDLQIREKRDQLLNIASKEVIRLNQLIENFLHFAKPEEHPKKPAYLSEILKETILLFTNGHPKIEIEYRQKLANEKAILLDKNKIHQLFWNVLNNSADAMDGNGQIVVVLSQDIPSMYKVLVLDEGIGLPPNPTNDIFDPFITTKQRGTGLGLSIVKRIADEHDSFISLINHKDGKGAVFELDMPVGDVV
ncbi:MAG: hypothetical protein KDD46_04630 [Bdellovibrionales bacterium]|nr:hypothetical protein [Bdellovibrionales bacterium]